MDGPVLTGLAVRPSSGRSLRRGDDPLRVFLIAPSARAEVLADLERAQELEPDLALSRGVYGFVEMVTGNIDEARQAFSEAVRLDPDDSLSRLYLGTLAISVLDWETAERELRTANRLHPEAGYSGRLAYGLMTQGRLDEAEAEARTGMRRNVLGRLSLVWVHHYRHEYDEALAIWEDLERTQRQLLATGELLKAVPGITRRLVEHRERLDELLASGGEGATADEDLLLAWHAQFAQRFATAALAYARAFVKDPGIPTAMPVYYTQAASCVLRAGWANCRDRGVEPPSWDTALRWMRNDLEQQDQMLNEVGLSERRKIGEQLSDNLLNPIYGSARDPNLGDQPLEEQQRWRAYWHDLRSLLQRAHR